MHLLSSLSGQILAGGGGKELRSPVSHICFWIPGTQGSSGTQRWEMENSKSSSFLFVEKDNLILIKVIKFKCLFFKKQKVLPSYGFGSYVLCVLRKGTGPLWSSASLSIKGG